jgi:hypothetical protein
MACNTSILEHFSLKVKKEIKVVLRKLEKHQTLCFPPSTVRVFKSRQMK